MDDFISRAAAKKIVSLMVCAPSVKIQAEHSIDNLPAVDAVPVGWISVNDRLPVNLGTVIVANKAGVSFAYFNGAYWERGAATKHKPIKTITHWMPLPEPPKMDGDANG